MSPRRRRFISVEHHGRRAPLRFVGFAADAALAKDHCFRLANREKARRARAPRRVAWSDGQPTLALIANLWMPTPTPKHSAEARRWLVLVASTTGEARDRTRTCPQANGRLSPWAGRGTPDGWGPHVLTSQGRGVARRRGPTSSSAVAASAETAASARRSGRPHARAADQADRRHLRAEADRRGAWDNGQQRLAYALKQRRLE